VLPAPSCLESVSVLFSSSETKRNAEGFANFSLQDQRFFALWKDGAIIFIPKKVQHGLGGRSLVHNRTMLIFIETTVTLVILDLVTLLISESIDKNSVKWIRY
jgi:hypothetical protein